MNVKLKKKKKIIISEWDFIVSAKRKEKNFLKK